MLHSLWLMMFETSKHVPLSQKCGYIFKNISNTSAIQTIWKITMILTNIRKQILYLKA